MNFSIDLEHLEQLEWFKSSDLCIIEGFVFVSMNEWDINFLTNKDLNFSMVFYSYKILFFTFYCENFYLKKIYFKIFFNELN